MYNINFYTNKKNKNDVKTYIEKLSKTKTKSDRIKLNKIIAYINMLSKYGLKLGEPYIKHIEGAIWELMPQKNRIFFREYRWK